MMITALLTTTEVLISQLLPFLLKLKTMIKISATIMTIWDKILIWISRVINSFNNIFYMHVIFEMRLLISLVIAVLSLPYGSYSYSCFTVQHVIFMQDSDEHRVERFLIVIRLVMLNGKIALISTGGGCCEKAMDHHYGRKNAFI